MKTLDEKDRNVFIRLGISIICATGSGLLLAATSFCVADRFMPVTRTMPGSGTVSEMSHGHVVIACTVGIAAGLAVLTLLTRNFVLRTGTITD